MTAEIIAVGEEVLCGDVINSNAAIISKELVDLGIEVRYHSVIGDYEEDILNQLTIASKRSDFIILSGGLGPTEDDLTKESVAKFVGKKMIKDEKLIQEIKEWFKARKFEPTNNNFKQGYKIEDSMPLKNNNGTAPGAYIKYENKHIFLLPGPPRELMPMFKESVKPIIKPLIDTFIESAIFKLTNIGESKVATVLSDIMKSNRNFTLASYAKLREVQLKATAIGKDKNLLKKQISEVRTIIYERLGEFIYAEGEEDLIEVVIQKLSKNNQTLSLAESCTGGKIANSFIDKAGVSKVFMQGLVTYSNEAKENLLGVKNETLLKYGAVSKETAIEMVQGLIDKYSSDYGISVTGIAGPDGGTKEKPVGLVYISVASKKECKTYKHIFNGSRNNVRDMAAKLAAIHLYDLLD